MLYTSLDLFIAELISVFASFLMYHLLADKNRVGWLFYWLASVAIIYVLWFKDSYMSVCNQSMMAILAIKNYFWFHHPQHQLHRYLDRLTLVVFLGSLYFINGWNGKAISELILWIGIIGKTLLLGKKSIGGWYFQIFQQLVSIVFGLYREIYMFVLKSIIFTIQGIYGVWKWNGNHKN